MLRREVIIPTRGNVEAVLAGLIPHHSCFMSLRIIAERMPESLAARRLIETFQRLGRPVTVEMQQKPGVGPARAQGIAHSTAEHVLFLDDDAVLEPWDAILRMERALQHALWVMPIVRFAQGFVDPLPGHTEIWCRTTRQNPVVQRALAARGEGWIRAFDTGENVPTDQLGGTCFSARRAALMPFVDELALWPSGVPGEDAWLGRQLGNGCAVAGAFCYHFGDFGGEWDHSRLAHALIAGREPWTA